MPLFPEHILQEISEKNDIYDIVSQYVTLKKAGSSYIGLCPFHNEKTPSFSVSPQKGIFHCFGCGEGGTVISFLSKVENISFYEACKNLAERANITLPDAGISTYDAEEKKRRDDERAKLFEINKAAALFFYDNLKNAKSAVEYLKKRQLTGADAKKFWIGYAPSGNRLFEHLKSKGFIESDILRAGLIQANDSGKYYDKFRNRVIFPIFDVKNNIIGFGGRVLDDSKPKYLNSPDSAIFSKGKNLYFLNAAKGSKKDFVILAEGYMDVISLAKAGFVNTVATLGTAITDDQARLIKRYFKEVVICYDTDDAGRRATDRAIGILRKCGMKISVLNLPGGKDPDEFIKMHGKERFASCLKVRKTDMEYLIEYYAQKYDLSSYDSRITYINELLPYLSMIDNKVELDVYASALAKKTGVSLSAVYSQLGVKTKSAPVGSTEKVTVASMMKSTPALELARRSMLSLIASEKSIFDKNRERLTEEMFGDGDCLMIYRFIRDCYDNGRTPDLTLIADDDMLRGTVTAIMSIDDNFEQSQKAFDDYLINIKQQIKQEVVLKALETGDIDKINNLLK